MLSADVTSKDPGHFLAFSGTSTEGTVAFVKPHGGFLKQAVPSSIKHPFIDGIFHDFPV